jgi:endonuclease-3
MTRLSPERVLNQLEAFYGRPKPPKVADPWLQVVWENVAYLADDVCRAEAFAQLERSLGTEPEAILAAPDEALSAVTSFGILPDDRMAKLRRRARTALDEFDGDVGQTLKWPLAKAKKALQKFPGIGAPGAGKILLFARAHLVFGLESNGMRVLLRLGHGSESKSYATTYRSVQAAVKEDLKPEFAWLIRAHQLLRRHGQELCRRSKPLSPNCPLASDCPWYHNEHARGT